MQSRIVDEKYQIVRELSKGGMGAVYEARHVRTDRKVALKLILADTLGRESSPDALRRFEREARAGGSIDSRHVVPVTDMGVDSATGNPYIVMELLVGEDLRELIQRFKTLPAELVLRIASQACLGLERAHERGIIHRDIKSGNIYLARRDGAQVEVKILDFGIAKLRAEPLASTERHDLTRSGAVLGSPLYMSPEQATGNKDIDERADLWSLGVVLYEALSGRLPHANQTLGALILAICSQPARPLRQIAPWVPVEVAAIVHKALALEPAQRFANARAMRTAIDALIRGDPGISEAMIEEAGSETRIPTEPGEPLEVPALTPGGQTTADAVTLGHSQPRRPAPTTRGVARWLVAGVGAGGLVAAWAFLRPMPSAVSSAHVGTEAGPAPPAPIAELTRPTSSPVAAPKEAPAPSAERAASSSTPSTSESPRSRGPSPPVTRRRVERTTPSASVAAPPPPPRTVAPPAAPATRPAEPAIDRRFD